MELFLPSIAALLIAGIIVFLVLPRLGAPILAVLSLVLLAYAINNHMQLFSSEYRYSTWQEQFTKYGPFILIGVLILVSLGFISYLFMGSGASALPATNLPANNIAVQAVNEAANQVTNVAAQATEGVQNAVVGLKDAVVGVANAAANGATKAANDVAQAVGVGATNTKNTLQNLANILKTPVANRRPNAQIF
jgi:hypothetical protein